MAPPRGCGAIVFHKTPDEVPGERDRRRYRNVAYSGVDPAENIARLAVRPGNSDICFVCPGAIADAEAHLARHGVEIETGQVERIGARGTGTSVYFRDPDGSLLDFNSYTP